MRCKKCKEKISKGNKFCRKCGEPVTQRKNGKGVLFLVLAIGVVAVCAGVLIWNYFPDIQSAVVGNHQENGDQPTAEAHSEAEMSEAFQEYRSISDSVSDIMRSHEDESGYIRESDMSSVLDEVESFGSKHDAVIAVERNSDNVILTLRSGIKRVVTPAIEGYLAQSTQSSAILMEPWFAEGSKSLRMVDDSDGGSEGEDSEPESVFKQIVEAAAIEAGIGSDENSYLADSAVTVESMKGLKDNQLIVYYGHGAYSKSQGSMLTTGDEDNLANFVKYFGDMVAGRIMTGDGRLLVSSAFFDEYCGSGSLDGSNVFLIACHSLQDTKLADSLVRCGAHTVTGFDESVINIYGYCILYGMLGIDEAEGLLDLSEDGDYYTFAESLENTKVAYGEEDSYWTEYWWSHYPKEEWHEPAVARCYPEEVANTERLLEVVRNDPNARGNRQQVKGSTSKDIALVLDVSGSMAGDPMDATRNAASRFVDVALENDAQAAVIAYDDDAEVLSEFTSSEAYLKTAIGQLDSGGGTDMESGLASAKSLLTRERAENQYIVLMSDGQPNDGKIGDELISFAESIRDPDRDGRDDVIIYALGFNEDASGQSLLRAIASDGCYISVQDADDLEAFFQDMVDSINGVKFMYARVACPVDVSVTFNGETLDSAGDDPKTRTSFGSLTFEKDEGGSSADPVKVLRLREGQSYDISIDGTGFGVMNYSIGFIDDKGIYSDFRTFSGIDITDRTAIRTTAEATETTTLSVDEDGDGVVDKTYRAGANQEGELVDTSWIVRAIVAGFAVLALIVVGVLLWRALRRHQT